MDDALYSVFYILLITIQLTCHLKTHFASSNKTSDQLYLNHIRAHVFLYKQKSGDSRELRKSSLIPSEI